MSMVSFSTDDVPQNTRDKYFAQQMQRRFGLGLAVEATTDGPLSTRVTAYCGRQLRFASLDFSPHRTSCTPVRTDEPDRLVISVQTTGVAHVSQAGRSNAIAAGQMFVLDPTEPFSIETAAMRTRSVYLSADSVRSVCPDLDAITARPIELRSGPGLIFASMFEQLFEIASELDERTADSIAQAMPYMFATLVEGSDANAREQCVSRQLTHKQRIQQFAREHLRDPKLDASMIANGVSLSVRHVYELFEPGSTSLMKWVWSERLERCRQDLSASALLGRPVGAIAYSWGFSDLCHFSRTFKQHFGVSPRKWRSTARERG